MGTNSFFSRASFFVFCLAALAPLSAPSVFAEGSTGPTLRRSLSQLEFDEGFVPAHKIQANSVLAQPRTLTVPVVTPAVIQQSKPIASKPGAIKSAAKATAKLKVMAKKSDGKTTAGARAMLGINPLSEQKLENQIIVPRLRGPFTDSGDAKTIKSALSWKPRKKAQCGLPLDGSEMCNKSRALKETLYRFSGNHDFFDSQCNESCRTPEEISVPQGLNILASSDASFRFATEDETCRYELDKKSNSNDWHVMTPSRVSCVCLPKSCFLN